MALIILKLKTIKMNLKKIIPLFLIAMSFTVGMPVLATVEMPVTKTEKPVDGRSLELSNRLREIRNMDKTNLTKEEKKALKEEKKAIKKEKKEGNGRILGLGILGVVLVVLLLIWIF
jgi:hypothetical protein